VAQRSRAASTVDGREEEEEEAEGAVVVVVPAFHAAGAGTAGDEHTLTKTLRPEGNGKRRGVSGPSSGVGGPQGATVFVLTTIHALGTKARMRFWCGGGAVGAAVAAPDVGVGVWSAMVLVLVLPLLRLCCCLWTLAIMPCEC
jgi:hypothetical protein